MLAFSPREWQAVMQFLNLAVLLTSFHKPRLHSIITFRMIKISLEHGICGISAFAFAIYGTLLLGEPFNDIEQGHKIGRLALGIMKRLNAVEVSSAEND